MLLLLFYVLTSVLHPRPRLAATERVPAVGLWVPGPAVLDPASASGAELLIRSGSEDPEGKRALRESRHGDTSSVIRQLLGFLNKLG